jgi:hypothetical protein
MFRRLFFDDFSIRAEFARRLTSAWLTRALRAGAGLPRIPTRRVAEDWSGGYSSIVATPEGRAWADRWWAEALDAVET